MPSRILYPTTAFFLLAALLATTLLYWPGLNGPFLLDDMQNIVRVHVADFDKDELLYAVTHNTSGIAGRPLSVLSLVFSGIVHGPESWGYKYHNLLIHLINGLLLFWLLLKLLPEMAAQLSREKVLLIAGLAASIWLLHPLMVSTVLYAVQRMAQLSTLFTLAALLFYVFARAHLGGKRWKFFSLAYLGFPLAMVLAFLSKENGALIPLYVLAVEVIVFGFRYKDRTEQRRLLIFLGIFVALPLVLGSIYALTHLDRLADYSMRNYSLPERLMTQLHVVVFYLKLILLPRLSDMSLYHDQFEVIRQLDFLTAGLLLLLVVAVALVFIMRKRAPVASFAIAWFLISHLMESTFINLEMVFEHRNYLAAAGLVLAVIYYLFAARYSGVKYVSVALVALFMFLTANRVQVWKSTPMLYQMAVIEHPESERAHTEYANLAFNSGEVEAALKHLDIAQNLDKKELGSVLHEIVYRCDSGYDLTPLFEEARSRAESYPVSAYAMNGFDNLLGLYNKGRCSEVSLDRVMSVVQAAKVPYENNLKYLGYLERVQGRIQILQGNYVDGVMTITKAYEHTQMPMILVELANTQLNLGRVGDARQLIAYLERINRESHGTEAAKIQPLKKRLAELETKGKEQADAQEKASIE